ncbi:hypothetical protein, partial [Methanoregula sp.]|uniref:hypothetical protein n=1 Tax=Methanoregula sp. TaxID=2052170 RepID=UPI003562BA9A
VIFRIVQVAISHEICQKNRIIGSVLICPFPKISPIWGYFKSKPDTGFFWGVKWVIGGQIGPGLGRVCTGTQDKVGKASLSPCCPQKNTHKDVPAFWENVRVRC